MHGWYWNIPSVVNDDGGLICCNASVVAMFKFLFFIKTAIATYGYYGTVEIGVLGYLTFSLWFQVSLSIATHVLNLAAQTIIHPPTKYFIPVSPPLWTLSLFVVASVLALWTISSYYRQIFLSVIPCITFPCQVQVLLVSCVLGILLYILQIWSPPICSGNFAQSFLE